MNRNYHQQNRNQQYGNQQNRNQQYGNQYGNQQYGNRSQPSLKEQLERELRQLERDLVALDCEIDALGEKGRLLDCAKSSHMSQVPGAIAQVALSTLGVRFLPPVARTWYYKYEQYRRSEEILKQAALNLHTRRQAICAQMFQTEVQLEQLQYRP